MNLAAQQHVGEQEQTQDLPHILSRLGERDKRNDGTVPQPTADQKNNREIHQEHNESHKKIHRTLLAHLKVFLTHSGDMTATCVK